MKSKKISSAMGDYERLEQVIGHKWSVCVLEAVRKGVNRPGALERCIEGISTKVLSERLRNLTLYGLLHKHSFAEIPPRTEYSLTRAGEALVEILARIHDLDARLLLPRGRHDHIDARRDPLIEA
jgi:DNA-binding HxlR family transcriptional regulator